MKCSHYPQSFTLIIFFCLQIQKLNCQISPGLTQPVNRAAFTIGVVHRVTTNDNEWCTEWQRVATSGTTSDNEWQRMTTSDNKWQLVTASDSKWYNEWNGTVHFKEWMIVIPTMTKTDTLLQVLDGLQIEWLSKETALKVFQESSWSW